MKAEMKSCSIILVFGLTFLLQSGVRSQEISSQIPVPYGDRPAQYILGSNDVLLITVNLWGHVLKPGIYSIPSTFGIIDLLSSAGGPLKSARLKDVRIIRRSQEVFTVNIEEFIKSGNRDLLLPLQPGDVIVVSGKASEIWTNLMSVVRDIAIIANLIFIASRIE